MFKEAVHKYLYQELMSPKVTQCLRLDQNRQICFGTNIKGSPVKGRIGPDPVRTVLIKNQNFSYFRELDSATGPWFYP